jgi:hypothetical protein
LSSIHHSRINCSAARHDSHRLLSPIWRHSGHPNTRFAILFSHAIMPFSSTLPQSFHSMPARALPASCHRIQA